MSDTDRAQATIVALSSGAPPAAIGIIRVSGPQAAAAVEILAGKLPEARRASLARLHGQSGNLLDEAVVLWFPGPETATGEDLAEFHCHGGRAVLAAVHEAVLAVPGVRPAEAGEFTRRSFANGRIDLSEAEGLADLLSAETELQRAAAIANASGVVSAMVVNWRDAVLRLSAQVEAALDFADEDDVDELPDGFTWNITQMQSQLIDWLERPRSEKLGEGFRVALAGPPNAGKSTLFNALVESEAAITSPIAGTTRDVIERNVAIDGVPFSFVDTAGLRQAGEDDIEAIGIDRAHAELEKADIVLWLGDEGSGPEGAWEIATRKDGDNFVSKASARFELSGLTGEGVAELKSALVHNARTSLPKPGEGALNLRQHILLSQASAALQACEAQSDLLLIGEDLRVARGCFDRLIGRSTTEDMLDALFGRFCIGK